MASEFDKIDVCVKCKIRKFCNEQPEDMSCETVKKLWEVGETEAMKLKRAIALNELPYPYDLPTATEAVIYDG